MNLLKQYFFEYVKNIDQEIKPTRSKRNVLDIVPDIFNGILQIVGIVKQFKQDNKISDLSKISHNNRKAINLISEEIAKTQNTILLERKHNNEKFNILLEGLCNLKNNMDTNLAVLRADQVFTTFRNHAEAEAFSLFKGDIPNRKEYFHAIKAACLATANHLDHDDQINFCRTFVKDIPEGMKPKLENLEYDQNNLYIRFNILIPKPPN